MSNDRLKRKTSLNSAEIMQTFERTTEKMLKKDGNLEWKKAVEKNNADAAPIIEELVRKGFMIKDSIGDIRRIAVNHSIYKKAIPILLYWLPRVENEDIKTALVGALATAKARGEETAKALLQALSQSDKFGWNYKGNLGWAISCVANDGVLNDLIAVIKDKRQPIRSILVSGLANMKSPVAVDVLIELLEDEKVRLSAINALYKLKAKKACACVRPFLHHADKEISQKSKRFIEKLCC